MHKVISTLIQSSNNLRWITLPSEMEAITKTVWITFLKGGKLGRSRSEYRSDEELNHRYVIYLAAMFAAFER